MQQYGWGTVCVTLQLEGRPPLHHQMCARIQHICFVLPSTYSGNFSFGQSPELLPYFLSYKNYLLFFCFQTYPLDQHSLFLMKSMVKEQEGPQQVTLRRICIINEQYDQNLEV